MYCDKKDDIMIIIITKKKTFVNSVGLCVFCVLLFALLYKLFLKMYQLLFSLQYVFLWL